MDWQGPPRPEAKHPNKANLVQAPPPEPPNQAAHKINVKTLIQIAYNMERHILQLVIPEGADTKDADKQPVDEFVIGEEEVFRLYADPHGEGVFETEYE